MRSSIKIIKPNRGEATNNLPPVQHEKSVAENTREMVSTVKSWIAELQDRKRAQRHSLELWGTL